MNKKNGGFSLVELIVVVAIMAIAVGAIAPQLIRYLEKSNVSSDLQLADSIRSSVALAICDAKIVEDPASKPWIATMESPNGLDICSDSTFASADCLLTESLTDSFGFCITDIDEQFRSARGSNSKCNIKVVNEVVQITITETDNTGRKDRSDLTPENDIHIQ